MIGLGVDLCQVSRMEAALEKGEGFLKRYFTREEQAYILSRGKLGPQSAAAMFAAKEAFLKALGVGLNGGIALCQIGVRHDERGAPFYALDEAAAQKLREKGGSRLHLSLTHDGGVAAAVAVVE